MLEVVTGSRLHFGLLELAAGQPMRFGGLGLMLDEPGWVLRFGNKANAHNVGSAYAEIANDIAARIEKVRELMRQQTGQDLNTQVDVLRTLPLHSGLGAGTQLATAVALGLSLSSRLTTEPKIDDLVRNSGRGKRSGIGLYGFLHGGLILDEGHSLETVRVIHATSVSVIRDWRVVLITPDQVDAVTGGYEANLLKQLGQAANAKRDRMFELAKRSLELASDEGGFDNFTNVLQEYVDAAGELFSPGQGGMYNGDSVGRAVELAKESGLRAVGQSSWGPTVFGFGKSQMDAEQIAAKLIEMRPNERWQTRICTPARQGASWRWLEE